MDAFIGEVRAFTWNWPPAGWALCWGQQMSLYQQQALGAVIGYHFGGDSTKQLFNLPDLRGASPMGTGAGPGLTPRTIAQTGGTETVTLTLTNLAQHAHIYSVGGPSVPENETATPAADGTTYDSRLWDTSVNPAAPLNAYIKASAGPVNTGFAAQAIGTTGQGQPHENRQPLLVVNYCICLEGTFPIAS